MSQTKSILEVQPAITDSSTFFVQLQTTTVGLTPTLFANPNLTYVPNTNTLGLNGTMNLNGVLLPNNSAERRANPSIINNTVTINLSDATVFDVTLNANITSFIVLNTQTIERVSSFVLMTTGDGTARAVVWPTNYRWPSGVAPSVTSTVNKRDVFVFFTVDGGSTWQSFVTGQNI